VADDSPDTAAPDSSPREESTGVDSLREPTPVQVDVLTRRMAKGEEEAFRVFYAAYGGRLSRYLLVIAHGNEDRAAEALQATLVRVARYVKPLPDEAVFWSWLTVLARTSLFDVGRAKRRYLSFLDRFLLHDRMVRDAGREAGEERRLTALLQEQVESLPPEERRLIERKYYERYSVREIAAAANKSEKAVESLLVRIRAKLKRAVLEELQDEERS
jgi:RNA polymerase sigma factor (sigma-70 family)